MSVRIIATGVFLFVLVTAAWAQDGIGSPVTGGEWLKAFGVAVATAMMSYGAMHVRVQHVERDLEKKANRETVDQALVALTERMIEARDDSKEEMRASSALVTELTRTVAKLTEVVATNAATEKRHR